MTVDTVPQHVPASSFPPEPYTPTSDADPCTECGGTGSPDAARIRTCQPCGGTGLAYQL